MAQSAIRRPATHRLFLFGMTSLNTNLTNISNRGINIDTATLSSLLHFSTRTIL